LDLIVCLLDEVGPSLSDGCRITEVSGMVDEETEIVIARLVGIIVEELLSLC
jgi:hypothetical protein